MRPINGTSRDQTPDSGATGTGRFVRHDSLLVVDEIQPSPDLLLAIKQEVDLDPRPGRFLLSGSADVLALARTRDSLAGRLAIVELHPLSQGEIDVRPDGLVERLLGESFEPDEPAAPEHVESYLARATRGGYPEAVDLADRDRPDFFASYLATMLERDARELSRIRTPAQLATVLSVLADRHTHSLAVESAARDSGLPRSTFDDRLALLERLLLVQLIPALATSATRRSVKQRKLLLADSGLAAHLIGAGAAGHRLAGTTIEGFALLELVRQISWSDPRTRLLHYRSKDGAEVDAVIEGPDRRLVGIEVKATESPRPDDARHLRHLARMVGRRFARGVVLHAGTTVARYDEDIWALPISSLWTTTRP